MTNRASLYTLLVVALAAWGGLLLFTRWLAPTSIAVFLIFFLILLVALISTFAPVAYLLGHRVFAAGRARPPVRVAIRQSTLLSVVIVLNLLLKALHSWNLAMGVVMLGAAVVVEILFLARKW
ncbi:MAG TPA: hypothetical protein VHZ51_15340 [Ktedonobacteraceae bacterium]|jgi:hypothetical protein|nr:hypothetical protein [Ktedonobacteraceae bacterium]